MGSDATRPDPADLTRVPFLAELSTAEVEALCTAATQRSLGEGERVFEAGDPSRELFVILAGEVAIELDVDGGSPVQLATLGPGTIFGEVNFLLGSERSASARALRETRCLVFDRDAVEELEGLGKQALSQVMTTIARVLALRLTQADREMTRLAERVRSRHPEAADVLEDLGERRGRLLHSWQG